MTENELKTIIEDLITFCSVLEGAASQLRLSAEKLVGTVSERKPQSVLSLEEKELLEHQGWKSKKLGEGEYAEGTLNWGWDFSNNFSPETVNWVKMERLVEGHVFSLGVDGKIVSVKKAK